MDEKKRVAVIGAGPAGITAAYQLSKSSHINVDLFEASSSVGGLAKSITLWNQTVDIGPHRFFSSDKEVNALWLEVVKTDYRMVDRLTRIMYDGQFYLYPLKPLDALSKLGVFEASHCLFSFILQKFRRSSSHETFEDWVTDRFGKRIFQIFFKTYSEKLWGISCDDLDADFAAQRIKKLSLFEVIKSAFHLGKKNKHKTLVDQFAYPVDGTGMVYERMRLAIEARGGRVLTGAPVKRVVTENNKVTGLELDNGEFHDYQDVISSMPLTLLVARLNDVPPAIIALNAKLKFRNTILVYLRIDSEDLFPDNWLYIHSRGLRVGRITNFRNWVPHLYKNEQTSILALEYWCYDDDDIWLWQNDKIVELAKEEIQATRLIKHAKVLDGHVLRIPRCYPVYNRGYKEILGPIETFLKSIDGLSVIGRYGAFKYNNQDHSILMGIRAAENISGGVDHDLWKINTDYDSYQEGYIITSTGLAKS